MANESDRSVTPALDQWVAEVGESGIATKVQALRDAVDSESILVLRDLSALHQFWDGPR